MDKAHSGLAADAREPDLQPQSTPECNSARCFEFLNPESRLSAFPCLLCLIYMRPVDHIEPDGSDKIRKLEAWMRTSSAVPIMETWVCSTADRNAVMTRPTPFYPSIDYGLFRTPMLESDPTQLHIRDQYLQFSMKARHGVSGGPSNPVRGLFIRHPRAAEANWVCEVEVMTRNDGLTYYLLSILLCRL